MKVQSTVQDVDVKLLIQGIARKLVKLRQVNKFIICTPS